MTVHYIDHPPPGTRNRGQRGLFRDTAIHGPGNTYFLLFTDRLSRHADVLSVAGASFTAEGTTNVHINRYILWGCPSDILSGNGLQLGLQLRYKLPRVVY